jgi:hypothetical protein
MDQRERSELIFLVLVCIDEIGSDMAVLDRHRVTWTGFIGAPGVSTFYCATGFPMNAHLHTFFVAIASVIPTDVTITIEPSGDSIESTTGSLTGTWADTTPAPVVGSDATSYSAVSGLLIAWTTSVFLSGRRLRGHTFIVPIGADIYDTAGQVAGAAAVSVEAAAQALVTAGSGTQMIWQRPRVAQASYTDRRGVVHPAITARGGGFGSVSTAVCRRLVTELRSRRD